MRTWPALDVWADLHQPDFFQAALVDYDVVAIDDSAHDRWRVFFHDSAERDRAQADLAPAFPALAFFPVDVPDEDWAARSQANLRAVHVGNIIVAPPWDVPEGSDAHPTVIVIQPSMGFGTGHHATTRLCLAALQRLDLRGCSAIDVGTGSGVLAIAASLLGASPVVAIDDDPDAIQSACENIAMNGAAAVEARILDLRTTTLPAAGVVTANLTGGLLMQAAARLIELTDAPGRLILSGLMKHEEAEVLAAFGGMTVLHRAEEDEWLCVTLTRLAPSLAP